MRYLLSQGLRLVRRNYRVSRGPYRRGGEIDLIFRDVDGTVVFVEVRSRASARCGGSAASVSRAKQDCLRYAASVFVARLPSPPPCRFDVVAIDGAQLAWLPAAFDAS